MNIAVVGSGSWGTAIAVLLNNNGHAVTLWSYTEEESAVIRENRENPRLPGIKIPMTINCTSDCECISNNKVVVLAPPSYAMRSVAHTVAPYIDADSIIVSLTKGIEPDTGLRMSQIAQSEINRPMVALSGPSHAEEVGRGIPTGVVAACADKEIAKFIQKIFSSDSFRVYTGSDVIGVELGAALKNVIAVCAGISDGLGCGDNTKALLITRGLEEIARLGMAMGARRETLSGLAGMGDLIVTCTSMHSRNRRAGILIGEGNTAEKAMDMVGAVVEGYYAAKSAMMLAGKLDIEMPITEAAYRVMYENADPAAIIVDLMRRKQIPEHIL